MTLWARVLVAIGVGVVLTLAVLPALAHVRLWFHRRPR